MASLKTFSKQHDVHFVSSYSNLCKIDKKIGYGLWCCYPGLTSSIHGLSSFRSQLHPLAEYGHLWLRETKMVTFIIIPEFTNQRIVLHLIKMQSLQQKKTAVGTGIKNLHAVSSCEAY